MILLVLSRIPVCLCIATSSDVRCVFDDLAGTTTVKLALEGLDIMNDDPSQVDVLFMKVRQDSELEKINKVARMRTI